MESVQNENSDENLDKLISNDLRMSSPSVINARQKREHWRARKSPPITSTMTIDAGNSGGGVRNTSGAAVRRDDTQHDRLRKMNFVRSLSAMPSISSSSEVSPPAHPSHQHLSPSAPHNSQQIENEFQNLSLEFRTDAATVNERAKLHQHQRAVAEQDFQTEIQELKSQIIELKKLIFELPSGPKLIAIVERLRKQSEIVEDATNTLCLKSELSGSVNYEQKLTNAFRIAQMHVDNLKRAKERDERELEDIKRLLCLPNEQSTVAGDSDHGKNTTIWLNQEKPLDQFEENILKLATNTATPISGAAASKINFIRLRRASVASMDYQSKEITRRSRVFKPELKILRQSENLAEKPSTELSKMARIDENNNNKVMPEDAPKTSQTFPSIPTNNFKELCKKYRDKLAETWIEEQEEKDDSSSECCQDDYKEAVATPLPTPSDLLSLTDQQATKDAAANFLKLPENVREILKSTVEFFRVKNEVCILEFVKLAENIDVISSQEDFVQCRCFAAAFLLFVSLMLFIWNILLPSMV